MLIPSIDLMGGRIVQLQQGERLAFASDDIDGWMARFAGFPVVQLIDLDAAKRTGDNHDLVRRICGTLPCQLGGGISTPARARAAIDAGARRVIVGSALFTGEGVNLSAAEGFAREFDHSQLVAAVDARAGFVTVRGWSASVPITAVSAMSSLEPYVGAFLYTHVDTEGLLGGFDLELARSLRAATQAGVIVAGGIRSKAEVDALDQLGVDAVVGMALYTGSDLES